MEHYKNLNHLNRKVLTGVGNLNNELVALVKPSAEAVPLSVLSYGITFPDPDYYIKRSRSDCFVLEYIVQGKGTLIKDGVKYAVSANDVWLLEPCSSNKYFPNKENPFKKYWINFKSDIFFDICKQYGLLGHTLFNDVNLEKEFQQLFDLEQSVISNDDIYRRVSTILFGMLMLLSESIKQRETASDMAQNIKRVLDKSVYKRITLDEISKDVFVSKTQITREFKKYYHTTPYEYILGKRLEASFKLLLNTDKNINDIAELLCFSDGHHFSNFFKLKVGICPKEYRQKNESGEKRQD